MQFGIRELLFLGLLLAMPMASYFFVFQPRNEWKVQARAEIRQKQEKLAQLDEATANMFDIGGEIDRLSNAIEVYEQKLPAQREVEVILKEVWELAHKHSLTPKSVRTDKIVSTAHYAELPIKMVIVGDFDGFYSFLLDLEKLPRITRMPTMKLKKIDREEGAMQADVVLTIFFEGDRPRSAQPSLAEHRL